MKRNLLFIFALFASLGLSAQVSITMNVNMENETVDPSGVYVAGGGNFGNPGDNQMLDPDGDGIYSITVMQPVGFSSFYTFTNGACADYSCKENLAGQACGDPNNFNDRFIPAVTQDTVITTCFAQCSTDGTCMTPPVDANVTFSVDMNEYIGIPITTVYVSGTFNGWGATDNPLEDADMDGVWEATFAIPDGPIEFKYQVNGWMAEETFAGGESCTVSNGGFTNRALTISGDATIPTVCFNSCDACGVVADMVSITMNVNMNLYTVSADGVSLAGGSGFGGPGDNPMLDPDGDGIYSITLMRPVGFTSNYTFVNGPSWGEKENIAGQPCADAGNFNDRLPITVNQDTVINTCFAECTDDTNCTPLGVDGMVTFSVDMNEYVGIPITTVYVSGTFNGWAATDNPLADDDMDGVWEATYAIPAGNIEFKYQIDGWMAEESFVGGESCTVSNGGFTNRALTVNGDATLPTVCFNSCNACGFVVDMVSITMNVNMNQYTVSADGVSLAGGSGFGGPGDNPMLDPDGDGIYSITLMRPVGFTSNYTFVNGSGWGDKENIAGLPCSDPDNFDDRLPVTVNQDTVINTCFAECTDDTNCTPVNMVSITMNVNMSEYTVSADGVSLAGGAAFGQPGDNPMLDPDGDGIYSVTLMRAAGTTSNYTFVNGDWWDAKEDIEGLPCADPDNFNDRLAVTFNQDTVINTCFAECTDDTNCTPVSSDMVSITMNLNMNEWDVDPGGVYVAGGGNFGNPGDNEMLDPDGDGVYTITVMQPVGFSSFYTFTNGACADYSCKENIAGQSCADPANYNDRFIPAVTQDTVINTCFQECSDDLECTPIAEPLNVTFQVNMQDEATSMDGVFIGANFDGWSGGLAMEDPDNDDIWTLTMEVPQGLAEFKFLNGGWAGEEILDPTEDAACTLTTGAFTNRTLDVAGSDDIVMDLVCFNACVNCIGIGTKNILSENTIFRLAPSLTNGTPVMLYFDDAAKAQRTLRITNTIGQVVYQAAIGATATQHAIETVDLSNGLYYVMVESDQQIALEKFIVSK